VPNLPATVVDDQQGIKDTRRPAGDLSWDDAAHQRLQALAAAVARLKAAELKPISRNALEHDGALKAVLGGRKGLRQFLDISFERGWLRESGEGKAKQIVLTGTALILAGVDGEVQQGCGDFTTPPVTL
jgi:hypothetical protein